MRRYTVYTDGKKSAIGSLRPDEHEAELRLIKLYHQYTDQHWEGFGGAATESAAYTWSLMDPLQRQELIDAYFSPEGLNYSVVRVPLDSCDFSIAEYEAAPGGDLSRFDTGRSLQYILPMLRAIREVKKDISLLLSPWSPPAAFKSNGKRQHGGKCLPEHWEDWAEYLCRYVKEFSDLGFRVFGITLQNEPHAVQTWDSCLWTGEEEREFLIRHVRPALDRNGFKEVGIYIWDHNKERVLDRALTELAGEGAGAAAGVAFHWYSGDHFDALRQLHRLFPEHKLMLSEHCLGTEVGAKNERSGRNNIAHELWGDLESGMNYAFDWNILLDEQGGPNYVDNFCHAPYRYDRGAGLLARQGIYDAYWHFAHFLAPGDVRILSSSFDSAQVEATAFRKPDGAIVLVLRNAGQDADAAVSLDGQLAALRLPADSLLTVVIEG